MSDIQLDDRKLRQLIKAFKNNVPEARVGVLGAKARRTAQGASNAVIGAAHEFGTSTLPIRSFLRTPITENLDRELQKAGAFDETKLKEVIRSGSITEWVKKIGIVAERIVGQAFDTGGFGKWPPSDMRRKANHQTLVETQQLRNSITSEVK